MGEFSAWDTLLKGEGGNKRKCISGGKNVEIDCPENMKNVWEEEMNKVKSTENAYPFFAFFGEKNEISCSRGKINLVQNIHPCFLLLCP